MRCLVGSLRPSFLSTLSLRRATAVCANVRAPRLNFYPRSPCGERLTVSTFKILAALFLSTLSLRRATSIFKAKISIMEFLSTLSLRRATFALSYWIWKTDISIHALLAESDSASSAWWIAHRHFYPRSPCGERRTALPTSTDAELFLSTLSLRRAT